MGKEILQNKDEIFRRLQKKSTIDDSGCWLWTGALNNVTHGHGIIKLWKHGPKFYVHRLSAYLFLNYDLDDKEHQVNHFCLNQNCWDPQHLYIGTQTDNMQDMSRNIFQCPQGHLYTPENTRYEIRDGVRHKHCKECTRISFRKWYDKQKESKEPVQLELPFDSPTEEDNDAKHDRR